MDPGHFGRAAVLARVERVRCLAGLRRTHHQADGDLSHDIGAPTQKQAGLSLRPAGAPEASFSARSHLRLPHAPASLRESASRRISRLGCSGRPCRACIRHSGAQSDGDELEQLRLHARVEAMQLKVAPAHAALAEEALGGGGKSVKGCRPTGSLLTERLIAHLGDGVEGNELESLRLGPQVCRHLLEGVEGSCALVDVLLVHCGQSERRWG